MIDQIGRYRIAGELGRGAMGVVYRAEDPAIGRTVAIKSIRLADVADVRERERLRERLMREAQSAGILSHPGIVTIYDIAEENGLCYIFMEFVNGLTLDRLIATGGLPEPNALIEILRQTAAALDYAHEHGIVHRDVKPANIMVDGNGAAKVTDFGVARFLSHDMTQTGALMGTPSYMSPEQIQGHPVDGRADQFALAVVVYEALTGEKPFTADSLPALIYRIVRDDPAPAQRVNQSLNGGVDGVLRKALSKDPSQRFPTCTDFIQTLSGALASARNWKPLPPGASASMPTVVLPAPPTVSAKQAVVPPRLAAAPKAKSKGGSLALGLLIGAFTVIVVLSLIFVLPKLMSNGYAGGAPAAQSPAQGPAPAAALPGAPDTRPSPMGPPSTAAENQQAPTSTASPQDAAVEPVAEDGGPQPTEEQRPAEPRQTPAVTRSQEGSAAAIHPVRILADPPGSRVVVDGNESLACSSPCSLNLPPGRHTLVAKHAGYHNALKIFEVPRNSEVQFGLSQAAGQLIIRTNPAGASIYLNGALQQKVTPAVLTVPAGHYRLSVVKDGYQRQDDEMEIRDGAISNYEFNWIH